MPFVISKESLTTYERDCLLYIEEFLSDDHFKSFKQAVIDSLSQVPKGFMSRYLNGRDLFRSKEEIRKCLLKKDMQKLTTALTQQRKLLFGFDQIWDVRNDPATLFLEPLSIQEIASVKPLALGALFCLEGESDHPLFPKKPNDILFFHPGRPILWQEIPKGQMFMIIGFAPTDAVYFENEKDPNTHLMKRLEYQPNQPLHSKTHPLIKG